MRVLGNDIVEIDAGFLAETGTVMVPLESLLEQADFVSVNCDLNPTSLRLMDASRIQQMKPGAVLINTARGPIVDQRALVNGLLAGKPAGAALDVFEDEPLPMDSPLRSFDNIMLAPHNSNASPAAWERVHRNSIERLFEGLRLPPPGF
jgi:phosphoglycerate dehydrogenase-like enzyme